MTELVTEEAAAEAPPTLAAARFTGGAALLAVLVTALWGTNPTALKIALRTLPPIGAAGLRFTLAAIGVWIWCRASGVRARPRAGEALWLAAIGAFFLAQISTFTLGVYWGSAGHSVVLLHTYPFFVVALAHFLIPGDRASPGRVAGLIAAFCGVVILFVGDWGSWQGTQLLGDGVQLFSAFLLGSQVVFTKHAVARIDPARVVLWEMIIGSAGFLVYSLAFEGLAGARPSTISMGAVVYQGIMIGALCFTVWTWLIRRHAASHVAIFGFVAPLVGVVLSSVVLGEPLTATLLLSAVLVAVGIVLANLW